MPQTSNLIQHAGLHNALVSILRIAIGWHFFWEGSLKLSQPHWSAEGYLNASWGPLAPLFQGMTTLTVKNTPILSNLLSDNWDKTHWILEIINFTMPWMLFLAGLGLLLGLFTRVSALLAMALLSLFIASMPSVDLLPAWPVEDWTPYAADLESAQWAGGSVKGTEGNYFLISKNLIEFLMLSVFLTLNPKKLYGIDALFDQTEKEESTETQVVYHKPVEQS